MKGLVIAIVILLGIALVWFLAAQTDTDVSSTDDTVTAETTTDTDYSDDVARVEQEFEQAYISVENNVEAGVDASVEGLEAFVNNVEIAAQAAGDNVAQAYAAFVSSARAQIENLRQRIDDVDVDVEADAEVNANEDGNSTAQ